MLTSRRRSFLHITCSPRAHKHFYFLQLLHLLHKLTAQASSDLPSDSPVTCIICSTVLRLRTLYRHIVYVAKHAIAPLIVRFVSEYAHVHVKLPRLDVVCSSSALFGAVFGADECMQAAAWHHPQTVARQPRVVSTVNGHLHPYGTQTKCG